MEDHIHRSLEELERLVTTQDATSDLQRFFGECFRLPGNPFPPGGIADPSGENSPLQGEIFNRIVSFIQHTYSSRQRQFLVIRGDYGTGKTHTLRFIERVVNTMMNKGDRAARAVYVERPRIEAQELNRAILRSLGFDTVRKYIWFAVRQIFRAEIIEGAEELDELKRNLASASPSKGGRRSPNLGLDFWKPMFDSVFNVDVVADYRTFLEQLEINGWKRENVRHYLIHLLLKAIGDDSSTDLAQLFVALLLSPDEASFSSWETLVGISNIKAKSSLRTPEFLRFLLRLMQLNGIAYVYLLLDEFEEVSQGHLLSARQRQDYLYTIRELLNSIQEGLSIVIAISPGGWDAIVNIATPLADVNDVPLDLSRITIDQTISLVRFYFERERRSTQYETEQGTAPLTDEVIAYILEKLPPGIQPTPRNLIQFLHYLLNYAAENELCGFDSETLSNLLEGFAAAKSAGGRLSRGRN